MAESWEDQKARVGLMATDGKWDLSDNDRAAVKAVLQRLDAHEARAPGTPVVLVDEHVVPPKEREPETEPFRVEAVQPPLFAHGIELVEPPQGNLVVEVLTRHLDGTTLVQEYRYSAWSEFVADFTRFATYPSGPGTTRSGEVALRIWREASPVAVILPPSRQELSERAADEMGLAAAMASKPSVTPA